MSQEERNELRSTLALLKYLHTFHNEYEDKLSMSHEESVEHRLNIMEEIDRITRLLDNEDEPFTGMDA